MRNLKLTIIFCSILFGLQNLLAHVHLMQGTSPISWDLSESNNYIKNGKLEYHIVTSGTYAVTAVTGSTASQVQEIIEHSFKSWEMVSSANIAFTRGSDSTNAATDYQSMFTVSFNSNGKTPWGGDLTGTVLGLASSTWNPTTAKFTGTDICLSSSHSTDRSNNFDLEATMVHEIGHSIGLDHSPQATSVMSYVGVSDFPDLASGNAGRFLDSDDIVGVTSIYPSGNHHGKIKGKVVIGTSNVHKAMVGIFDADNLLIATALTEQGAYEIGGIPVGNYTLRLYPVMTSDTLNMESAPLTSGTPTSFLSTSDITDISIQSGQTTTVADINVNSGTPQVNPQVAFYSTSTSSSFGWQPINSGLRIEPGQTKTFSFYGTGLPNQSSDLNSLTYLDDEVSISQIEYSGSEHTAEYPASNTFGTSTSITFKVTASANARHGARALFLKSNAQPNERFIYMGALKVFTHPKAEYSINPTNLTLNEGSSHNLTLKLDHAPIQNVVIQASSSNTQEATISPSQFTFTPLNWNIAQSANVLAVEDQVTGNHQAQLTFKVDSSLSDNLYASLADKTLSVSINDNDQQTAGLLIGPNLTINEKGGGGNIDVSLKTLPTHDVKVLINSSNTQDINFTPSALTFTSSNGNIVQKVMVTAIDDTIAHQDYATLTFSVDSTSSDNNYNSLPSQSRQITLIDDDQAGLTLSSNQLVLNEKDGNESTSIKLNSQPHHQVLVDVINNHPNEIITSPANILFNTSNWNTPQNIQIQGKDDAIDRNDFANISLRIHDAASDQAYKSLPDLMVHVRLTDDDQAGYMLTPLSGNTHESGGNIQFSIQLKSQPTASVNLILSSNLISEGDVEPKSIVFNESNWGQQKNFIVHGKDDPFFDGPRPYSIHIQRLTSDNLYFNLTPPALHLINDDNEDLKHIFVSSPASTQIIEDTTFNFPIKLSANVIGKQRQLSLVSAPNGMTINSSNILTWTPVQSQIGKHTFHIKYKDEFIHVEHPAELEVLAFNDPPIISTIPPIQTLEDQGKSINLSSFKSDEEDQGAALKWSLENVDFSKYKATILGDNLQLDPLANVSGNFLFTLHLSDSGQKGASNTIAFHVTPVNDRPEIKPLPAIFLKDGNNSSFDYSSFIHDVETPTAQLTVTASSNRSELIVSKQSGNILQFSAQSGFKGHVEVLLTASDESLSANQILKVDVTSNNPPTIAKINPIQFNEDSPFSTNLINFKSDIEDPADSLTWAALGDNLFSANMVGDVLHLTPKANAHGPGQVQLTLKDKEGASSSVAVPVTILPINDPPVWSKLPTTEIDEEQLYTTDLFPFVHDIDNPDETLILSANTSSTNIHVSISDKRFLNIRPGGNFVGESLIQVHASDNALMASSNFLLKVKNLPDAPHISMIPPRTFNEDTELRLNLKHFVSDPEDPFSSLTFSASSGNTQLLKVRIDGSELIFTPQLHQHGVTNVELIATDPSSNHSKQTFQVQITPVNDRPVVNLGPDLVINPGQSVTIQAHVSDIDGDTPKPTWTWTNRDNIIATSTNTFSPTFSSNVSGIHKITLLVNDGKISGTAEDSLTLRFNQIPSEVSAGPDKKGNIDRPIFIRGQAKDGDNDNLRYNWTILEQPPSSSLLITGPDKKDASFTPSIHGKYTLRLTVDDGFAKVSDDITITVDPAGSDPIIPDASTVNAGLQNINQILPSDNKSLSEEETNTIIIEVAQISAGTLDKDERGTVFNAIQSAVKNDNVKTLDSTAIVGALGALKDLLPTSKLSNNTSPEKSEMNSAIDVLDQLSQKAQLDDSQINSGVELLGRVIDNQKGAGKLNESTTFSGEESRKLDSTLRNMSLELATQFSSEDAKNGQSKNITSGTVSLSVKAIEPNQKETLTGITESKTGLKLDLPSEALKNAGVMMMTVNELNPYEDLDSTALASPVIHLELFNIQTQSNEKVNNLNEPIRITFPFTPGNVSFDKAEVSFFDENSNQWSTTGIKEVSRDESAQTIEVEVTHLTPFSLTEKKPAPPLSEQLSGGGCLMKRIK